MVLPRRTVLRAITVIAILAFALVPAVSFAAPNTPATRMLVLTPLPAQLPTNSSGRTGFPALVVSMTDLHGNILVASNDTVVFLSSSQSAVLSVDQTVTIPAGRQNAVANVYTTASPGNSTVTAVAPGFESASTSFTTYIARGYPTGLRVYPLPATFPAGRQSSATFGVAVVDAAGLPARTIQTTNVNVASSNTSILTVGNAQIPVNQTIGYFSASAAGLAGTAEITASASGLVSDPLFIQVEAANGIAVSLQLSTPRVDLPADGKTYNVLTVSLMDNSSQPVVAASGVQVLLTSSRTDIATTPPTVIIPPGQSFVTIPVSTSPASGSTFITASATNFVSSSVTVSTVSIPPTQLGVYLSETRALVSTTSNTLNLVVQLQDSSGIPAEARTPAHVIISFSNSSLMQEPLTLTIPKGADLVYANLPLAGATSGTFTAISNGLTPDSAQFSASRLQVTYTFTAALQTMNIGQSTAVYFSVNLQGIPVSGALLSWSSHSGRLSQDSTTTDGTGSSSVTFAPTSTGISIVIVNATSPLIGSVNATLAIPVTVAQNNQPSLASQLLSFPYVLVIVAAAAAAAIVVFLFIRRRRRAAEAEGAISEDEPGFSYFRTGPILDSGVR